MPLLSIEHNRRAEERVRGIFAADFDLTSVDVSSKESYNRDVNDYDEWYSHPCIYGLLELEVVASQRLRMAEIRAGQDLFYQAQLQALHKDEAYWDMWKSCNSLRLANVSLLLAAKPDTVPLPEMRFPLEIQFLFISACAATHGELKNLCSVCKAWNQEVLTKCAFFGSLVFKNRQNDARACRRVEYWLCSSIRSLGVEDTITSITLYKWTIDSHCWFLHVLNCVTDVKIISSGRWPWLYCLPNTVQKLLVRDTDIRADTTNDRNSWDGKTWRADHDVLASPFPPVPKYSCVLSELAVYDDGPRYANIDHIIDGITGPLEEILVASDVNTAWPRRLDATEVSTLRLGFGDSVDINPDVWNVWSLCVHDLTIGATDDDHDAVVSLVDFIHLDDLHLEMDLGSRSFLWALQVIRTWSESEKSSFELVIYDDKALESIDERRCTLEVQDADTGWWSDCDSWQIWWNFFTDALLEGFSPCSENHGTRFHGKFVVTFITSEVLVGLPPPSSHFAYAGKLLEAYRMRVRWLKLQEPETTVHLLPFEAYRSF
ncbi:uncharacterized protein EV420DRAFT_1639889 [Desarmillaria tabescens]|uniref:Uncharacterized protein n=1 Tax=Armillaria tabescens TaxID=1929756 RepID=A0AA39NBN5_ARMTA|nr:uncharacterized protein EV420DRAFT_1639889 [Desarmillaria tabescens]KAK0462670.1 hypothetical protein EV420DRAFT_1639889 [Desarmillaria tabescens]